MAALLHMQTQLQSPPTKFHSPSKAALLRSEQLLHRVILPNLLKQERAHAFGKRPQIRMATEADLKIQRVLDSTTNFKDHLLILKKEFQNLEAKVDKLELEREKVQKHHMIHQLSFSAGTEISPPLTPCKSESVDNKQRRATPQRLAKLKPLSLQNLKTSSVIMSPASPTFKSKSVMECSRKKTLLDTCLTRLHLQVKTECGALQNVFEDNFKVLKFKRAEDCLLCMIKLQRKMKGLENNVYKLRDRLHLVGI